MDMRHRGWSKQENVGPVRRIARGIGFILLAPVAFVVGILLLPFALIARLFGFRPRFARHGCGGYKRNGRGEDASVDPADAGRAAQV